MASKLGLYNAALRHLGAVRLASLTANRSDRYELDQVYAEALLHMLGEGNWKFALRTVELTADADVDVGFGTYTSAFGQPDDFVRMAGFSTDENFAVEIDFHQEGAFWYLNQSPVYLRYVSSDLSYGLNLGLYPPNYTEAVGAWLAFQAAMPVTKSAEIKDRAFAYYNRFLNRAKEVEALGNPVKFPPRGTWAASRGAANRVSFPVPGKMHIRG